MSFPGVFHPNFSQQPQQSNFQRQQFSQQSFPSQGQQFQQPFNPYNQQLSSQRRPFNPQDSSNIPPPIQPPPTSSDDMNRYFSSFTGLSRMVNNPPSPYTMMQSEDKSIEENYNIFLHKIPSVPEHISEKSKPSNILNLYLYIRDPYNKYDSKMIQIVRKNHNNGNFYDINDIAQNPANWEWNSNMQYIDIRPSKGSVIKINTPINEIEDGIIPEYLISIRPFDFQPDNSQLIFVVVASNEYHDYNNYDLMIYQHDKRGQLFELTNISGISDEFIGYTICTIPGTDLFPVNQSIEDRFDFRVNQTYSDGITEKVWNKFYEWFY